MTREWKVYGRDSHRQAQSFGKSEVLDFSTAKEVRIIEIDREDKTGTNDYAIVRITRKTARECKRELNGQLSDGLFEGCAYGIVEEITND